MNNYPSTFHEVDTYLAALPSQKRDYDSRLEHVLHVLAQLGNPQNNRPAIHVAGTSGKGSVSYFASQLLIEAGYSVGLSVSPHVSTVAERAQINGSPLGEAEYCHHFAEFIKLTEKLDTELSYIECMDIFAYWLFDQLNMNYMVIEVGLGGRLDPTNVMTREDKIAVISDIGLDHMEILGDTIEKIAAEKAGIIMTRNDVVMHQQPKEVMDVIKQKCQAESAALAVIDDDAPIDVDHLPAFQKRNWRLAHKAVALRLVRDERPELSNKAMKDSLNIKIPGRFELFTFGRKPIVLDAAHNPQKIAALVESTKGMFKGKIMYVCSFGDNKQTSVAESLQIMHSLTDHIVVTEFKLDFDGSHGAIPLDDLALAADKAGFGDIHTETDPIKAIELAVASEDIAAIVVTGSFYLVGNVRDYLIKAY